MAFRRRFSRARAPSAKRRPNFIRNDFSAPLTNDGLVDEFVIAAGLDWIPTDIQTTIAKSCLVKRIRMQVSLTFLGDPLITTSSGYFWKVYRLDIDEGTPTSIIGGQFGNQERVLDQGVVAFTSSQQGVAPASPFYEIFRPIDIDIKSAVKLRNDEIIAFGIESLSDISELVATSLLASSSAVVFLP